MAIALVLTGCGKNTADDSNETTTDSETTTTATAIEVENADSDMFTKRDLNADYDESTSAIIKLNGNSATSTSNAVEISGSTVTIKDEGTYIISGTLNNGMIIVNADENDKPQLVFNGVDITSKTSAPVYILECDKTVITLAEGTENTLTNGGTFTAIDENSIDGAVFSKQDLTFNGTGALTVTSPAGHGIVCKDDLVLVSGDYTISSASHGIDANDSVRVSTASLTIDSGKDGIHAENTDDTTKGFVYISNGTFDIAAEGDGISSGAYMQILNGTFDIIAGGGSENGSKSSSSSYGDFMGGGMPGGMGGGGGKNRPMSYSSATETATTTIATTADDSTSMKGIKSSGNMKISNGTFNIDSADDAVHSNASATISNGTFEIATGDDGIHAEATLTVENGKINITESYEGLEALDITIKDGDIDIVASDDGINAAGGTDSSGTTGGRDAMFGGMGGGGMMSSGNGSIVISGGNIYINASGDGIDANGYLKITGGYTVVVGPTQGDTATLDYDTSATITGGTFIGTGASGMAQSFSASENQGVYAVSVGSQSAGTKIVLEDSKGNEIISYTPELSFAVVILSSPDIETGETYKITVGSTSGEFKAS